MGSKGSISEVPGAEIYRFDRFSANAKNRLLFRDKEQIPLTPRVFDILLVFLANPGRVLEKDELIDKVWDAKFVEEGNLARNVSTLRKALGGNARDHRFIVTVPGRGYRFVSVVTKETTEVRSLPLSSSPDEASVATKNGEFVTSNAESEAHTAQKNLRWAVAASTSLIILVIAVWMAIRYQTPSEASINDAASIRSIAVIRLKNLSGDETNDYFSDGITESLVNSLSKIGGLKVVSPGSEKRFDTPEPDPVALGKQLSVDAVLEGSVRKDNDSVRLDVLLVSAKDGQVLWTGDSNEHIAEDIFALEDEIALGIADKLKIKLTAETGRAVSRRYTESPDAYQLYLRGRYFWNKRTAEGLKKGIEYFRQAIVVDPNYALAYAGIADCYAMLFSYDVLSPSESIPAAKNAALKAIQLDDTLAEPHCSLAYVETEYDRDWQAAENEYRTGIGLDPNYATCHHWYAMHLAYRGRFDESLKQIKEAQELEPLSLIINSNSGRILYFARQYDQSIDQLRSTIDLDPNFWGSHYKLAEVLEAAGRKQEAIEEYAKANELQGDKDLAGQLRTAFTKSGYQGALRAWLNLSQQRLHKTHVSPFNFAEIYTDLGQTEIALDWLEKAANDHCPWIVLIRSDPRFDVLRDNDRFKLLLNRLGL